MEPMLSYGGLAREDLENVDTGVILIGRPARDYPFACSMPTQQ